MKLTDTAIKKAKARSKAYKLADGDGMYLLVSKDATQLIMAIVAAVGGSFGLGHQAQKLYNKYRGL